MCVGGEGEGTKPFKGGGAKCPLPLPCQHDYTINYDYHVSAPRYKNTGHYHLAAPQVVRGA